MPTRVQFPAAALLLVAVACGGDSPSAPAVTFGADSVSLRPGETVQLRPQAAASGTAAFTFTSDNLNVVQVSTNGLLFARYPGTATITARVGSLSGTTRVHVGDTLHLGDFQSPLPQPAPVVSVFDHNLPFEFADTNGYLLSYWGEHLNGIDGHNGYDWLERTGTPVLAAAPGMVVFADTEATFACPLLGDRPVSGNAVEVLHAMADGTLIVTQYVHLSRIDVAYGDRVQTGTQLGLSGRTGCANVPHLHFGAFHVDPVTQARTVFDPYGWQVASPDPWATYPTGAASQAIWSAIGAPPIYRELDLVNVFSFPSPVVIDTARYMTIGDATSPNNEFVDVVANPNFGDADLTGFVLHAQSGATYTFPAGFRLASGATVRVYSGVGTDSPSALYWGRSAPVWDDNVDCAEIRDPTGAVLFNALWGGSACDGLPGSAASADRKSKLR